MVPAVPDRPLDEFVTEDGAESEADRTDGAEPAAPSVPTMRWSPDGPPCDACGESVARRWRSDGAFVCADCKEW